MCRENFRRPKQQGVALVLTMLMLVLLSIFALGLFSLLTSEARTAGQDFFSSQSFYAAVAGIEKMTNDLGKLYVFKTQPDPTDFPIVTGNPPTIDGYNLSEYRIDFNGTPTVTNIPSGPYEGLVALVQPYRLFVTATGTSTKSETRLRRDFLNNLIPLFQFGIFYDGDLEAHAGPLFNFGGRVHTNRDFYVTAGSQTVFSSRVTVFGEVVRDVRKNGDSAGPNGDPAFPGTVYIVDPNGRQQALLMSGTGEGGSVIGGPNIGGADPTRVYSPPGSPNGSNPDYSVWKTYSPGKFGANLLNKQTGIARALKLPLQVNGNDTIELIKRGKVDDSPVLKQSRYFYKPGVRISLGTVYPPDPVLGPGGCTITANPVAPAGWPPRCVPTTPVRGPHPNLNTVNPNIHFKVDIVSNTGGLTDVTQEFLNLGITDDPGNAVEANAILRLQRRNYVYNPTDPPGSAPYPITFYDLREGEVEDTFDTNVGLAGIMTVMELNMGKLSAWLKGDPPYAGLSGNKVPYNNGYVVYTSDRRGEVVVNGEFGYEDTIFRNNQLDPGEDLNGNGILDMDEKPNPLDTSSTDPAFIANYMLSDAKTFRRALRLVNGSALLFPTTVASENPIYVQGNYNSFNKKPASLAGDAVTILSTNWSDKNSYNENTSARLAAPTTVNAAIIAGTSLTVYANPRPPYKESHSNGGVHNLMRFLESWTGVTYTYTGSLVNLYLSRQAIGQWKCCTTVYNPPNRNWSFDVGFLNPATLPPATPHITIVEIQRFRRELHPALP